MQAMQFEVPSFNECLLKGNPISLLISLLLPLIIRNIKHKLKLHEQKSKEIYGKDTYETMPAKIGL